MTLALGALVVAGSGWGGLWLYGFAVGFVLAVVVLGSRGGELIQAWSRGRFRS